MSGIAGILGAEANETVAENMLKTIRHRGPDSSASHFWSDNVLLQTDHSYKLRDQVYPVSLELAGERYTIVFDGLIFNREELKRALDCNAEDMDDAQLMLRGYIAWKQAVLERVNGVFAVAIAHERENKLFLARDRMGVKPLFYAKQGNGLIFASEMKAIFSVPGVSAQLDALGAGELLLIGPGRIPGSGVFRDIHELKPAEYGIFQNGNLRLRTYWNLKDRVHNDSFEDTVERVRELITDAVLCQLPVDKIAGTMLSGGLDSSLVSAICARELDRCGMRLETFSVDYLNNDKYFQPNIFQPNQDVEFIRIMQDMLDSYHHWSMLSPEDLRQEIRAATVARDLPGMADVDTSLLAFCRQIKPYVSIVLSGECADEIFGGYPWYREPQMRDYAGFPWAQTTKERSGFLQDWLTNQIQPEEFVFDQYQQTIRQADIAPENSAVDRRTKELVNLNIQWFMQTLLERGDRMGNAAGVDIRVPFADYRIAEYLYGVPWDYKDYKGREKGLLRKAMEGILPHSVLYRKKSPYPKTYDPAYLDLVSKMLQQVLDNPNAPIYQLVKKEALENLLHQDFQWPWYGQLMRRPQTIVYMLQINDWLDHYSVRIV